MQMNWKVSLAFAAVVGIAVGATQALQAAEEQGPQQCYRLKWEAPGTCSTCTATCLGVGYYCCTIQVG
jgi:hypothetical protein